MRVPLSRRTYRLLTAIAALAGCTHVAGAPAGARHAWTVPHVLRLADVADPDSLDPLLSTMDLSYDLSSLVFSYLVIARRDGSAAGDLATTVPSLANGGVSPDGRTYTYHLRKGVRWHDGFPLTSRDVAFSWQAIMNPRNNVLHREGYEEVRSIDTPDLGTVVVHLRQRVLHRIARGRKTNRSGASAGGARVDQRRAVQRGSRRQRSVSIRAMGPRNAHRPRA
jgi:peptide/nickel transport system substrate-binding protein